MTPFDLTQLSRQLKTDIDSFCEWHFDNGPRSHLGASQIGNPCSKALWLAFRWTAHKVFDGRMQRLLNRGHFEEPRFKLYLTGVGFKVTEFDETRLNEVDKGKRQIRISACKGHFGGSVDGIAERDGQYFLVEYKTKATGKGFNELAAKGCKLKAPVHFAQQSIYGYKLGLKYSIYMVVDKNTDDLYVEVIELDHFLGAALEKKAELIIFSQEPPNGVSCSPSFYQCQWCDYCGVCYGSEQPLRNCRSCSNAHAVDNSEWLCEKWGNIIPKDFIKQACSEWQSII